MTSTIAQESAVAAAFAASMPTAAPLQARAAQASGDTGEALVVGYIGEVSAQLAVQLLDDEALVDGIPEAPLQDRLHAALSAAAGALGAGTLGDATIEDASAIFTHTLAQVFDLQDDAGRTIGRLAVRITHRSDSAGSGTSSRRLHRIAGVEMELTVEIGRTRMAVRDVLGLEPGRIVELDRSAGAPADVKLNGRTIAHGEVVVVDQDYAVRITRILENAEA